MVSLEFWFPESVKKAKKCLFLGAKSAAAQ